MAGCLDSNPVSNAVVTLKENGQVVHISARDIEIEGSVITVRSILLNLCHG